MPKTRDERFRAFADSIPVPLRLLTPGGQAVWFNDNWLSFVGRPPSELEGDGWAEAVHPDEFGWCLEAVATAAATRQPRTFDYRLRRADGEFRWVTETATPSSGSNGAVTGLVCSLIDVTESKRAEGRLAAADSDKARFLAAVAYAFQARLVSAADGLDLLDKSSLQAKRRRVLSMVREQVELARALVGGLAEASQIAIGRIALRKERVSMSEVVEAALAAARPALDVAGQKLVVRLPPPSVAVIADLTRLSRALELIVWSASDHTPEKGKINVFYTLTTDTVLVHIQDSGCRVAEDRLDLLFELFTQRELSYRGVPPELGLAMFTARRLVELHGGAIQATNSEAAHGLLMTVRLPLAPGRRMNK